MPPDPRIAIEVHLEEGGALASMAREVRDGLTALPKQLPSKYFYDERGSRLFERITELPEYYLTRAEQALLERSAEAVARITAPEELLELGSGSAKKTRVLIDAGLGQGTLRRYIPVEVSQEIVERAASELVRLYPGLEIHAFVGDFEHHLERVPDGGSRLVALLGSTIGNYPEAEAVDFLRKVKTLMGPDDWFLLGTDLVKDTAVLEAAYNDSQGVTALFNLNILDVVNRHLDGDFDTSAFDHVATYNEKERRIEAYLRSVRRQHVRLEQIDLDITFEKGEMLWTEVSCKYTRESVERILARAGFELRHWIESDGGAFALSLSRVA